MKRYLALATGVIFMFSWTASAYAIHATIPTETTVVVAPKDTEIRVGGEIRVRGFHQDNIGTAAAAPALAGFPYERPAASWYDQRVRLFLNAKTATNVTGRIHLETAGENITWGSANTLVRDTFLGGGVRLDILEAWLAYTGKGLFGVTSGIRAGHQPSVIGEGVFFDHRRRGDSAVLLYVEPAKGTEINLLTAKLSEGNIPATALAAATADNTNDLDLYSLMLTHNLDKDNIIGANYSIVSTADMDGGPGTLGSGGALYRMPLGTNDYHDANLNLHNVGLSAIGKVLDVGYKATADLQFGGVNDITGPVADVNFRGYGVTLGANYRIDPVTLRANFVYGSGDENTDNKNRAFQTFVANVIDPNLPTVVYGWRVATAADALSTGISNTTAFNLGLTFSPMKDMTAHVDYYLLRASEMLSATANTPGNSKDIGSEVNLRVTYKIARGLTYLINSGILFAGDFYRAAETGVLSEPKNAIVFHHGLAWSF